jgi:hypothetical protein
MKKKKRENGGSVESQALNSATVSVPTYDVCAEPSTSKPKIPPKCESGQSEIQVLHY